MAKPKLYIETTSFIDMAKEAVGTLPKDRDDDVWFSKKLLEANRDGKIAVYTATLTIAECQHADGITDERVQKIFKAMLTSGQYVSLVQDTVLVAESARNLRWNHKLAFRGADAMHVASALEMGCSEFITTDEKILSRAAELAGLGLRVIRAHQTSYLPAEYRQGKLGIIPPPTG